MNSDPTPNRLNDQPLWKLLVALDDAEREFGPASGTVKVLVRMIRDRLQQERRRSAPQAAPGGVPRA
jgi:hypothetical protein